MNSGTVPIHLSVVFERLVDERGGAVGQEPVEYCDLEFLQDFPADLQVSHTPWEFITEKTQYALAGRVY
ncbi:hypothetical protein [Kibdelosporangium aridum]|uniref:hypothetical protein n=1 Tax=Kibdelosporangium aridum TaxID=2030 RepID=UPI000F770FA0|nr:hypothetical protein [Kibdelosporangium aridum]